MTVAAGLEIMLAHDMAYAADGAMLGQVEARLGTTTLGGGAQRLVMRAGLARTKEMVFTGGLYDANTCHAWGIVNRVVKADELHAKALRAATRLAAGPTMALAAGKAVMNAYARASLGAADAALVGVSGSTFASADMQTGLEAFRTGGAAALMQALPFSGN